MTATWQHWYRYQYIRYLLLQITWFSTIYRATISPIVKPQNHMTVTWQYRYRYQFIRYVLLQITWQVMQPVVTWLPGKTLEHSSYTWSGTIWYPHQTYQWANPDNDRGAFDEGEWVGGGARLEPAQTQSRGVHLSFCLAGTGHPSHRELASSSTLSTIPEKRTRGGGGALYICRFWNCKFFLRNYENKTRVRRTVGTDNIWYMAHDKRYMTVGGGCFLALTSTMRIDRGKPVVYIGGESGGGGGKGEGGWVFFTRVTPKDFLTPA